MATDALPGELTHTDVSGVTFKKTVVQDRNLLTLARQVLGDLAAEIGALGTLHKGRRLARRLKVHGLDISIETDKGQNRYWYDPHAEGEKGVTKMKHPYGYIRRTMGADDEHVDVYIGPNQDSRRVFVIRQMKKPNFKHYDEDKVMMGFESPTEAKQAYLDHYNSPKFFGSMKEMDIDAFKEEFVTKALPLPVAAGVMMGPPPIDVETLEGVEHLLNRMGSVNDNELMQIASDIWGEGFQFQNVTPQQAREEVIGFLLDQRDLLLHAPRIPSPVNMLNEQQGSTDHSQVSSGEMIAQ